MPASNHDVLCRKVEAQLLRAARPALRRLSRASKGNADFRNEMELRACLGLARVAATLLRKGASASGSSDLDKTIRLLRKGGLR